MKHFQGRTAVITGGASGFGREFAHTAQSLGMNIVLADVEAGALEATRAELEALGARVLAVETDVSRAESMETLAEATLTRFGVPHLVFNNAGVAATGGLIWECPPSDWAWGLGVNLWGVIHGVRLFTPLMLEAAQRDADYEGHLVNSASMAGLLATPNMGVYNSSKHAVVGLSETLYQDLQLVSTQVGCSVLCPYYVPTGIFSSERNRPAGDAADTPQTASQQVAREMGLKATQSGRVSAAEVAALTFDAIAARRFWVFSHPRLLGAVEERMRAIVEGRNPPDPFAGRPEVGEALRARLRTAA